MKSIIVAGGIWQKFIVEFLKEKGCYTYIINPFKTDTVNLADEWIEADVKHVDKIERIIKEKDIQADFITSDQSEVAVVPAAELSKRLGLPGNSPDSIKLFTNKALMYDYAQSLDIPVAPFVKTKQLEEALEFAKNRPVIVKPADATSSRGFTKIENKSDLPKAIKKALNYSDEVIIQEFLEGLECCVEGLYDGKKHYSVAMCIKDHFRPGIASSLRYGPNLIKNDLERKIKKLNNKFVENSGISFGITHAEYIITGDSFWLIEIAARGGGCGISSSIMPWVSGIDAQDFLLKCLQGKPPEIKEILNREAILQFYEFPTGIQPQEKLIEINKIIEKMKHVYYWHFNFNEGEYLNPATSDQDRHALAIIHGEVDKTLKEIKNVLQGTLYKC